jgi:multicomponent Na+:H+ antiporter subunit C
VSNFEIYALAGAAIVALGLHGLVIRPGVLRKLIALNVIGAGVFLIIVALALGPGGDPDPVPHAMVLTGIVIAVSFTAFGAVLAVRLDRAGVERDDEPPDQEDSPG